MLLTFLASSRSLTSTPLSVRICSRRDWALPARALAVSLAGNTITATCVSGMCSLTGAVSSWADAAPASVIPRSEATRDPAVDSKIPVRQRGLPLAVRERLWRTARNDTALFLRRVVRRGAIAETPAGLDADHVHRHLARHRVPAADAGVGVGEFGLAGVEHVGFHVALELPVLAHRV